MDGEEVYLRSRRRRAVDRHRHGLQDPRAQRAVRYHNMFLNREITHGFGPLRLFNNRAMRKRSREYLDDIVRIASMDASGADVGGQRQAIAIARSTH